MIAVAVLMNVLTGVSVGVPGPVPADVYVWTWVLPPRDISNTSSGFVQVPVQGVFWEVTAPG